MKNREIIGIVGPGHFGSKLLRGYAQAKHRVFINNGTKERTERKLREIAIENVQAGSLEEIADACTTVILCIKHAQLEEVGAELKHLLNKKHLVISCLAQATLAEVQALLNDSEASIVKMMTTLGVGQRKGVSAYQLGSTDLVLENRVRQLVKKVSSKNCTMNLKTEKEMKLFTKLVGCLPGIMAYIVGQLELSAKNHGGEAFRQYSQMLSELLRSTADLLDEAGSVEELERQVATPGGYTVKTIDSLKGSGFSEIMDKAIMTGL
jgi:competence protein ComER